MIKISFSGIPDSGKSSLVSEVKKILSLKYRVDTIDEITIKNPFDEDKKSSFISQFFFMSTQMNEENIKSLKPLDYLLCDRSIVDQWVYWRSHIGGKDLNGNMEEKHRLLRELYRFWIKTYDIIFMIRGNQNEPEQRSSVNEFRKSDADHIKKMDEFFSLTIQEDTLSVIEIWNNSTIDESAHKIIQAITDYEQKSTP